VTTLAPVDVSEEECPVCTRIFWSDNPVAKVAARTMDWLVSDEPKLWILPAGVRRSGGLAGALEWASAYGSAVLSMFDSGTVDGINEKGLGAHSLYLDRAVFGSADDRPVIANTLWAQWVLDSFATVDEAVTAMKGLSVASVPVRDQDLHCHLSIEDALGDSAIIEPIDGRLVVHHGRQYTVMANDPTFDEQLDNVRRYAAFGGTLPLPGDILSADRFVRATYFLSHLPTPNNVEEALAGVVHLAENVAVPPGAPYDDFSVYPTWWISAVDLTMPTFYFWSRLSPNMVWVDLSKLDLDSGAPTMMVDPRTTGMAGDISGQLVAQAKGLPY
jgi:penicillin V acylase-like amidase (Ntn superfamily)